MNKKLVTLQDISCVGQCSLTVAHPIISACGVETIMLPSAVLSTHTAFTGFTFRDLSEDILPIMRHWIQEGMKFDCLYTGYLGNIAQIEYVSELRRQIINDDGLLIVDPAMADHGKLYYGFNDAFVERMARLCGTADMILPNLTEACFMTGLPLNEGICEESYILQLLDALAELGAGHIVLKGVSFEPDKLGVAVYDSSSGDLQYYFTKKLPRNYHGTGDCYAAAFAGALMQGKSVFDSASLAADFVADSIRRTIPDDDHWYGVKFEKALPMLVNSLNH